MSVEFNRVSLPSLSQMHSGIGESIPAGLLSDHDRFPSWEFIREDNDAEERRLLYRCAEGGFRWVHVDSDDIAYTSSRVSNGEAREIWIEHLLSFSEEETASLSKALQQGAIFKEALKSALGRIRVMDSFFLPEVDQTESGAARESAFCAEDGGLVVARLNPDDTLVGYRLIQGREAWDLIQPLIAPSETTEFD